MPKAITIEELNPIFCEVFENPTLKISPSTSAKDIHNWNSMNHILLINAIEQQYSVEFELSDLIAMNTVEEIMTALISKIK